MGGAISDSLGREWPLEVDINKAAITCQNCTYPGTPDVAVGWELDYDDWLRVWALNPGPGIGDGDPMSGTTKGIIAAGMVIKKFSAAVLKGLVDTFGGEGLPQLLVSQLLALGDSLLNVNPDCSAALLPTTSFLTTGYFGANVEIHSANKPAGKCSHGGMFDRDARGIEGISKDTSQPALSPRWDLHARAAQLASDATVQYLDDIRDAVCGTAAPKDCPLIKALYGIGPSLTFVIDTTGSMGDVIAAVQDAAVQIVNDVRGLDTGSPSVYVLAPFNDPDVPDATTYTDPDEFISAILALGAGGGGDCPELAMAGLANAVQATPPGGKIFLWTDAAAKDAADAGTVASDAKDKSLSITVFQFTSDCSTTEGFDTVTSVTGGSLEGGLSYDSAGATAEIAKQKTLSDSVSVTTYIFNWLGSVVGFRRAEPLSTTIKVPIDSSVSFIGFSVNSSDITMVITRPDGSTVGTSDSGVTEINLENGITITSQTPAVGVWTVTLAGTAWFSFNVFGTTNLLFSKFDFVELRGAHHEGLYPVAVNPAPGDVAIAYAAIEGSYTDATFEFRSISGDVLAELDMEPGTGEDDTAIPTNLYFGNVTIPDESFNVYIKGKDSTGADFLRVLPGLLTLGAGPSNSTIGSNTTTTRAPFGNSTTTTTARTAASSGTTTTLPSSAITACPTCQPSPCSTVVTELIR